MAEATDLTFRRHGIGHRLRRIQGTDGLWDPAVGPIGANAEPALAPQASRGKGGR